MRLVIAKKTAKKTTLKGSFFLYSDNPKELRALKPGKAFYPYVRDNGAFDLFGGLFKGAISNEVYRQKDSGHFRATASQVFNLAPADDAVFELRGSRIEPTYLEITKVKEKTLHGQEGAVVEGTLHNVYDPRLQYLDRSESTEFGEGAFDLEKMLVLYDNSLFYPEKSPLHEQVKRIADEQRTIFEELAADPDNVELKRRLDATSYLLKPHANEFFHRQDDLFYFVTNTGQWRLLNFPGNRKLNSHDKHRLIERLEADDLLNMGEDTEGKLRSQRENFYKKPMHSRFEFADHAALLPVTLSKERSAIKKEIEDRRNLLSSLRPSDGLAQPIPGLKEGVELHGHQALITAILKHTDRNAVDADPGAGKTLMQIVDVLQQMSAGKIKRPLIVVPQSLVEGFAVEVKKFSDLNPWIITTQSIKDWSGGDLDGFLKDAKTAPLNTIFITSYNWLAKTKKQVPNGQVVLKKGKYKYRDVTVFTNPYMLLQELGVDAVYADECHLLKNVSNTTDAISAFQKLDIVRGLTGTMMPGNLLDATGPMGFIQSSVLGTPDEFLERHSPTNNLNEYHPDAPKNIRKELQEFGVPQIRATAWSYALPKTHRKYHYVSFNATQEKLYESLLKASIDEIERDPKLSKAFTKFKLSLEEGELILPPNLLQRFIPLDKFLNAPAKAAAHHEFLLRNEDAKSPKSNKINEICSAHLSAPDHGKIIIFTQYKDSALNILEGMTPALREKAAYYDASQVDVRNRFMNSTMDPQILVGVDKSLRLGHNMQVANCIIHADSLWLAGDMRQRDDRAARLKQTREVHVHHVIVQNSSEVLKYSRVLSQQHMIAKANSDFEDKDVLPHVEMSMSSMLSVRGEEKLKPFISRQKKIEEFSLRQKDVDKEKFGVHLFKPTKYLPMPVKTLDLVPSTEDFQGNQNKSDYVTQEELNKLPDNPKNLKNIKFNFQNWGGVWMLTAFKLSDPQGFTRRLGFSLQNSYYFFEVSKGGVEKVLIALEKKGVEIINRREIGEQLSSGKALHSGKSGILKQLEHDSKRSVAAAAENLSIEFNFATIDGFPFVFTDNVRDGTPEADVLLKAKFREGSPFWYLPMTRSRLTVLLKKIGLKYPELRIADWNEFKDSVRLIFKVDLEDFDFLGAKK